MSLSETLKNINKHYIPGVSSFYERMANDPWQAAHDKLEGKLLLIGSNPSIISDYETECLKLIESAKAFLDVTQPMLPIDALIIGDPDRVSLLSSLSNDSCLSCGSKRNVSLTKPKAHPEGKLALYCEACG